MQNLNTRPLPAQADGFWLVTVASIIWGTIGVATQQIYNVDSTTPLFINLMRTLIATPILLMLCWHVVGLRMFTIQRRDFLIMMLTGTFLVLSQVAYFAGIKEAGVTITTLLTLCISPILVAFFSVILKFETISGRFLIALILAMSGSILLVAVDDPSNPGHNITAGTIYSLIAAVFYALMLIGGRFLATNYHPLQVTTIGFAAGTIVLLLINLASDVVIVQTSQGWALVLYLGLVPTAFAYWLFQVGLRSVNATTASIVIMLDPLVAAFLAWVLFGETLSPAGLIGAAQLISSLFILSVQRRR